MPDPEWTNPEAGSIYTRLFGVLSEWRLPPRLRALMHVPFLKPQPIQLSAHVDELKAQELSGIFSNFGPINTAFEARLLHTFFDGDGACVTACNATIALLLAIKEVTHFNKTRQGQYALLPSFTFAATAHAAAWCGLTPILYDIEPDSWLPSQDAELRLLERYGDEVAVIVPYATFGNSLDLGRYSELSARTGVGVVIDAAASLGSVDGEGRAFGRGAPMSVVYSMHATKTFATSEGAVIYSADPARVDRLRKMSNFGFNEHRAADMPGLNAKLAELPALLALKKLDEIDRVVQRRSALYDLYRELLPDFIFQAQTGERTAHQFAPALLPDTSAVSRDIFVKRMEEYRIHLRTYFSPHVAEQDYFKNTCLTGTLPVTERVASRIVAFPLYDTMGEDELRYVCEAAICCLR